MRLLEVLISFLITSNFAITP